MINDLAPIRYEDILDQLCSRGYAVVDGFIPAEECIALRELLINRKLEGAFRPAAIGKADEKTIVSTQRNDHILWLDENDAAEEIRSWFKRVRLLADSIKRGLFLPINNFECHFAHYPAGSFYKKHLDGFRDKDERLISVIAYLNPDWTKEDGGELKIYDHHVKPKSKQPVIDVIEPLMGRLVLLLSQEIPHEVAKSQNDRYSITGWLRNNHF